MPTLTRLLAGPHPVVCAVSQPDRPRGRGRALQAPPVARLARRAGVPLLQPERVGAPEVEAWLREHTPDLGVVVAFGQFLPRRIRRAPAKGYLINGHASLLPRHRGAAPIARAILAGDEVTGVSVMRVEREMDAGPVALARKLAIGPDETAGELEARLARLTAEAIAEALEQIAGDRVLWTPQRDADATVAAKLEKAEAQLDWRESAEALARRVRACSPSPGATTSLAGAPLRILAARSEPGPVDRACGCVQRDAPGSFRIATGDGWLRPVRLQRAGGKPLRVPEFLRGREIPDGTQLGSAATLDA